MSVAFASVSHAPALEEPAVEVLASQACRPLLFLCDHASNRMPAAYGDLGLSACDLDRHIAWDIGAAAVTRRLSGMFEATAVLSCCSRLVVDCNRRPDDADAMPVHADGSHVPANAALCATERASRIENFHRPYHDAVAAQVDRLSAHGVPALVSVHSFTPVMRGFARPWHVGVLWNRDGRLAEPLIAALQAIPGLCVGDNEPYSGRLCGYTMERHGHARGLPHVSVEIRQDLIADEAGAGLWAERLAAGLAPLLRLPEVAQVRHY